MTEPGWVEDQKVSTPSIPRFFLIDTAICPRLERTFPLDAFGLAQTAFVPSIGTVPSMGTPISSRNRRHAPPVPRACIPAQFGRSAGCGL